MKTFRLVAIMIAASALLRASMWLKTPSAHAAESSPEHPQMYHVYVGTFTWKQSKGIYLMRFDTATGALSQPELAVEGVSPSFLALHPNHRFLYSVNETDSLNGEPHGGVSAFSIDPQSGKLTLIDTQNSRGQSPTHIVLDAEGKNALVANYTNGTVAVFPIDAQGKLAPASCVEQHRGSGPDRSRQQGPHAHCISLDPANRFALSCDLGTDKVLVYRFDPVKGLVVPNDPPFGSVAPGSGPRHLAFAAGGKVLYVSNEMACTVTAFHYDPDRGALSEFQTIDTLPPDYKGEKSCAEVAVHPSGKFFYASNRGDSNTIAIFAIDPRTGRLTPIGRTSTLGKNPRFFTIDPTGNWLLVANQDTNNVVVFHIDPQTGELKPAGTNVDVPTPVCITFYAPQQ